MELAEPFEIRSRPSRAICKVLEEAGLIVRRVEGTKRPAGWRAERYGRRRRVARELRKALARNYDRLDSARGNAVRQNRQKRRKRHEQADLKTEGDTHVVVTRRFAPRPSWSIARTPNPS